MKYPQLVSMPSAVSDWLEEQLEARGIDAVIYTRYILSLLHSDTIDLIYSDEDLQFSHLNKEVKWSGGSRRRLRRSYWWKQADAEKLKRSAAVECLMSASEQTSGIESLVDELCTKLNEIKSEVDATDCTANDQNCSENREVSPEELADRYYAAFPPLNRNNNSSKVLIPKWIPSPKKKVNKKKQEETMKAGSRSVGKQRFGAYFTGRTSKKGMKDLSKKSRVESDRSLEDQEWDMNEDINMYDLPVDIKGLLNDSPPPQYEEMMNLANMRDTGNKKFIPYGTDITSSIWSNQIEDTAANFTSSDSLNLQFSSITINNAVDAWSNEDFFEPSNHQLSFLKLNHTKCSAFVEVPDRNQSNFFNPFDLSVASFGQDLKSESDKEDLLTSTSSHFRPIKEKVVESIRDYADGTTFTVCNNWDKLSYRRSTSGALYIEGDTQTKRKYCEYSIKNMPTSVDFVLKYLVCQNDKACQTDELDAEVEAMTSLATNKDFSIIDDATWKPRVSHCDNCNKGSDWDVKVEGSDPLWDEKNLRSIWSGGEVCHSCLGRPPSTLQHTKLREDVSQDGDQLLSDLQTIQNSYMIDFPMTAEFSCDIAAMLLPVERKRRHSTMTAQDDQSWSFASRIEEACLIQMSALPTLRSVTL